MKQCIILYFLEKRRLRLATNVKSATLDKGSLNMRRPP